MNQFSTISVSMSRSFLFLIGSVLFWSCSGDVTQDEKQDAGKLKEHLVNANKIFVESESAQIDAYLESHQLNMKVTGTGLRYLLFKNEYSSQDP